MELADTISPAMARESTSQWPFRSPPRWVYWVVFALACVAIIVTAAQSYRAIDRELTRAALARRGEVAQLAAATLSEKRARLVDLSVSLATRVRFSKVVAKAGLYWMLVNRIP